MRIGGLRKRMTLQRESLVADGFGGQVAQWSDVASLWGSVTPLTGFGALTENAEKRVTHGVTVRYRADVATGMRLLLGARSFLIRSVVNRDECGRWLDMVVEEGGELGA